MEIFSGQSPVVMALLATLFTWAVTALGAATVFFFKEIRPSVLNVMLGFSAGVMIAASFWSLLAPAIEMAEGGALPPWLVTGIGFIGGALFLLLTDYFLPVDKLKTEAVPKRSIAANRRSKLLMFSITLHNIPEGLAVGVAFGAAANGAEGTLLAATAVAFGIGLQNFPEGAAVSIPLRREGYTRRKSFLYGQASGIVEPISAVLGALLVTSMQSILPYALAFAAGAMIFVVAEELIPESQSAKREGTHWATLGCIAGFALMMVLDVAFG